MFSHCELFICLYLFIASSFAALINHSEKEFDCYSQEKVYHRKSDKCYKLLSKGPCESGEWLVLERPKKYDSRALINPICIKELCDDGQYYWPKERICVETKDVGRLCGESHNEELLNNVFGEGECSCAKEPPRARLNGDKRNSCHQLYTQGPCNHGQVLVLPPDELAKAICVHDPCHRESLLRRRNGSLSKDGILAPYKNGTCYELGTKGPCPDDLIFKVHATLLKPSCSSLTTTIFALEKRPNCYQDENGDCQQPVTNNKRRDAEKFKVELFNALRN